MEESLVEIGKRLCQQQQYQQAIAHFEKALRCEPMNADAHFELGKACFMLERYAEAKRAFQSAIDIDNKNYNARLLLGKTYIKEGAFEKAVGELKMVAGTAYDSENIALGIFEIYRDLGRFEEAYFYLDQARKFGCREEVYKKDLLELHKKQVRAVDELNFSGDYDAAIVETQKALGRVTDNDMVRNSLLNQREIAQKKLVLESKMRSLTFTITNRCNLKCLMCKTRKIPWDLPKKAKDEIITLFPYIERVMWQGGEVFLYDGFEDLLDAASQYPIRQLVVTNGMLLNEHIAEKIVRYNVELSVSIDACTKEIYEHIRPGAVFEKVIENVQMVNRLREKYNPSMITRMNVVVMRANYRQLEDFVDFAHRLKFTKLFLNSTGDDFVNQDENVFYYNHDDAVLTHINAVRDSLARKAEGYGLLLENWLPSERFFKNIDPTKKTVLEKQCRQEEQEQQEVRQEESRPAPQKLFCHAPWQRLYIDCGGKVRPDCLCHPDNYIGDLNESSLMELWNGKNMVRFRERIIAGQCKGFCNNDCLFGRAPEKNFKFI